jgi:DNA anti-recombination protein RmuC
MRIQKNRDEIEAYRAKAREDNTTLNQELIDEINELDRKNEALREKLTNYKHKNDQDWQSFKDELNRDLDEVGTAFRNLGRKKNK